MNDQRQHQQAREVAKRDIATDGIVVRRLFNDDLERLRFAIARKSGDGALGVESAVRDDQPACER